MPLCTQLFDYTHCRLVKNQKRKKKKRKNNKKASLPTQVLIFLFSCSSRCRRLFTRASQQMASRKMGLARHQIEDSLDSLMILQPTKNKTWMCACVRVCDYFSGQVKRSTCPVPPPKKKLEKKLIFLFRFLFFFYSFFNFFFNFCKYKNRYSFLHPFFFSLFQIWCGPWALCKKVSKRSIWLCKCFQLRVPIFFYEFKPKANWFSLFLSILKIIRRCHPFWGKKKKRTSSCLRGRLRRTWLPGLR